MASAQTLSGEQSPTVPRALSAILPLRTFSARPIRSARSVGYSLSRRHLIRAVESSAARRLFVRTSLIDAFPLCRPEPDTCRRAYGSFPFCCKPAALLRNNMRNCATTGIDDGSIYRGKNISMLDCATVCAYIGVMKRFRSRAPLPLYEAVQCCCKSAGGAL
jgi:hypothetical protein